MDSHGTPKYRRMGEVMSSRESKLDRAFQAVESSVHGRKRARKGLGRCEAASDKVDNTRRVTSSSLSLGTPIKLFTVSAQGDAAALLPRWEL